MLNQMHCRSLVILFLTGAFMTASHNGFSAPQPEDKVVGAVQGEEVRKFLLKEGFPLEFRPHEGAVLCHNPMEKPERRIFLLDYTTGDVINRLHSVEGSLSPDGLWMAGHDWSENVDGGFWIVFWPVGGGKVVRSREEHDEPVRGLTWLPDSRRVVTWDEEARASLWDRGEGGRKPALLGSFFNKEWRFTTVVSAPDRKRVAAAEGGGGHVVILDTHDRPMQLIRRLPKVIDPHYRKMEDDSFEDLLTGYRTSKRPGQDHIGMSFTGLAYFPDGRLLATGSEDCTVLVLDTETGEELARYHDPAGKRSSIEHLAVSPDGRFILFAAGTAPIRLLDWKQKRLVASFTGHVRERNGVKTEGGVTALAFTPDGRHALSGGEDRTVRTWKLPD
jgi:WD40 repeat protein